MTKNKLTAKQEMFCLAYLSNGFNGADACRKAGYKGSENTIKQIASENLAKPYIKQFIDKEKAKTSKKLNITRESLLNDLNKAKELALIEGDRQLPSYLKAIEIQAKMLGLNEPDKLELSGQIQNKMVVDFGER